MTPPPFGYKDKFATGQQAGDDVALEDLEDAGPEVPEDLEDHTPVDTPEAGQDAGAAAPAPFPGAPVEVPREALGVVDGDDVALEAPQAGGGAGALDSGEEA